MNAIRFIWSGIARVPVTIVVAVVALAIALAPSAAGALQLDRTALAAGQVWRLATCHVTHWNAEHLQWDLLMFVVLGAICEWRDPQRMRWCVGLAAGVVTAVVLSCFPEITAYRGLSGVDTALFTLLAIELVRDARQDGNRMLAFAAGSLLVGFAVKTLYEATTGQTFFVDEHAAGFVPLVWDHVAAGVVGLGVAHFHRQTTSGAECRFSLA
jgi:rhomboid family GlyGly-CTERM serine protease